MQKIVLKLREKDFDSFFKAGLEEADLTNNGLHKRAFSKNIQPVKKVGLSFGSKSTLCLSLDPLKHLECSIDNFQQYCY